MRGGARVIYFNRTANFTVVLLMVYVKAERENASAKPVKRTRHGFEQDGR